MPVIQWIYMEMAGVFSMDNVSKTLYIPLYGKAYVSHRGMILHDPKAEEIWSAEGFPLKGKSKSKWLAYYMGMRSAVFDRWVGEMFQKHPDSLVLHLGCGMDSRNLRVGTGAKAWFDVDFPAVIQERKRYYVESDCYQMVGSDLREETWMEELPGGGCAIIVMEGISMYLAPEDLKRLLKRLRAHFGEVHILMDCYTTLAAKASKYKNPINDVGVTAVYGIDDPEVLTVETGLSLVKEHNLTPEDLIGQLRSGEQKIFRTLYAGSFAKKLYRMYEFH